MSASEPSPPPVAADEAGLTLAALLRRRLPGRSWSQVRDLVARRRVTLNGEPSLDPARRVSEGDRVAVLDRAAPLPTAVVGSLNVRHLDEHVVVVEKPSGINTVRHPAEREWTPARKALSPTLEDRVYEVLGSRSPRLRVVHRLDKETSGLVVFARSVLAERMLGKQFHAHTVVRRYLTVVPGTLPAQTIRSRLVRDRGDGRRGSTPQPDVGKEAVTHVEMIERLSGYTLLGCRLETGRTHQIRIHLAERGHPVCGEKVYDRPPGGPPRPDESGAPRLALHATELGFRHPATGDSVHWEMPLPADLAGWLDRLRGERPA
jgi:23S rRNA pseudouridine1911/1915/1917 synthase